MTSTRVVLVDDHDIVRIGFTTVLNDEEDLVVVANAGTVADGLELITLHRPEVAVIDYRLPDGTGCELCEAVKEHAPDTAVVIFTALLTDKVIRHSVAAGAQAYVYKDVEAAELKSAIRVAARKRVGFDAVAASGDLPWPRRIRHHIDMPLSRRETEVLRLVAAGATNGDIADVMGLTENTIRTYLRRANNKLGTRSRDEAVDVAAARGEL